MRRRVPLTERARRVIGGGHSRDGDRSCSGGGPVLAANLREDGRVTVG
jgi:hypothetical protein